MSFFTTKTRQLRLGTAAKEKEKNGGGRLDAAVGYTAEKFGLGAIQSVEGAVDYVVGGAADLIGADEYAEQVMRDDWVDYGHADKWYNPSGAMKVVGDVAGGLGSTVPTLATAAGAAALTYFTGGAAAPAAIKAVGVVAAPLIAGLGAGGNATKEAYMETGDLGLKEWGYGTLSGATEAGVEVLTAGIGKGTGRLISGMTKKAMGEATEAVGKYSAKSVLKTLGGDMISEGFEEGFATFMSPIYARWTYDPDAEMATADEVLYDAFIGGMSGLIMGGTQQSINFGSSVSAGKKISDAGNADKMVTQATYGLAQIRVQMDQEDSLTARIDHSDASKLAKYQAKRQLKKTAENRKAAAAAIEEALFRWESLTPAERSSVKGYEVLGDLQKNDFLMRANAWVEMRVNELSQQSDEELTRVADQLREEAGESYTVEELRTDKSYVLTRIAVGELALKGFENSNATQSTAQGVQNAAQGAESDGLTEWEGLRDNDDMTPYGARSEAEGYLLAAAAREGVPKASIPAMVEAYRAGTSLSPEEFVDGWLDAVKLYGNGAAGHTSYAADSSLGRMSESQRAAAMEQGRLYGEAQARAKAKSEAKVQTDAKAKAEAKKEKTSDGAEGNEKSDKKMSFGGIAEDGKRIYKSNFPKGTPKSAKSERILQYIKDVWSKEPIPLVISNGETSRTIYAQFDPTIDENRLEPSDASKLAGGNRHGTASEKRVTLDLADDYYDIASTATYNYSKLEIGKDSETHKDVIMWHYFVEDIYFSEYDSDEKTPYTVTINVKEKANGDFVYSFNAEKESPTRRTLHADVITRKGNNGELFLDSSISQPKPIVNRKNLDSSKKSPGRVILEDGLNVRNDFNDRQYASYKAAELMAKVLGVDIVFHRSLHHGADVAAGYFSPKDGSIHININAMRDGQNMALYTLGHETVHYIQEWSPRKYAELESFVLRKLRESGEDVDALIDGKRAQLEESGDLKGLKEEQADALVREEVVAEAMEGVLSDGEVLADLQKRHRSLWEKIRDFVLSVIDKVKAAFGDLSGASQTARVLRDTVDALDGMKQLFYEGVVEAAEARESGAEGSTGLTRRNAGKVHVSNQYDFTKSFAEQVDDYKKQQFPKGDSLLVCETPETFRKVGFNALPMTINQTHVDYALNGTKNADHNIGESLLKQLPTTIQNPVAIITSKSPTGGSTSVVALLSIKHNGKQIIAPVFIDGHGKQNGIIIDSNAITSVHARGNAISNFLIGAIQDEAKGKIGVFYWNKKEALALLPKGKVIMPNNLNASSDGFIHSIRDKGSPVKPKFKNVTESQQFIHWFGNWLKHPKTASKIVNKDGTPKILYHQTDADISVFDPRQKGAGTTDDETPFGIFMKPTDTDIGLKGKKQMALYARIVNPLEVANRHELAQKLRTLSPEYARLKDEISALSVEYQAKIDQAAKDQEQYVAEYKEAHPDSPSSDIYNDQRFNELFDAEDHLVEEWETKANSLAVQCKEEITKALKENDYDGVIIHQDAGSFGRSTETYIALDPKQVKSATDNMGTYDGTNPDIHWSAGGDITESTDVSENASPYFKAAVERAGIDSEGTQHIATSDTKLKIRAGMSDAERAVALRNREISLSAMVDSTQILQIQEKYKFSKDSIESLTLTDRKKLIRDIGDEFGIFKSYENKDIELSFVYSKGNAKEGLNKQKKEYLQFVKMLSCLEKVINNAVGIEVHNRNPNDYKTDATLENVYVLASAFMDGDDIVPVKLEIKTFKDKKNVLYVAITLGSIKKDGIVKQEDANGVAQQYSPPSTISIADFFEKINPENESFCKYIPDDFLTEAQKAAKRRALDKDEAKYGRKFSASTEITEATKHKPDTVAEEAPDGDVLIAEAADTYRLLGQILEDMAESDADYRIVKEFQSHFRELDTLQARDRDMMNQIDALNQVLYHGDTAELRSKANAELRKIFAERGEVLDRMAAITKDTLRMYGMKPIRNLLVREEKRIKKHYQEQYRAKLDTERKVSTQTKEITVRTRAARRVLGRLNTMFFNQTKTKHVPQALRSLVEQVLSSEDLGDFQTLRKHMREISELESKIEQLEREPALTGEQQKKLDAMRYRYDELASASLAPKAQAEALFKAFEEYNQKANKGATLDADLMKRLSDDIKAMEGKPLSEMGVESIRAVEDFYKLLYHQINNANTLFAEERAEQISQLGDASVKEVEGSKLLKFLSPKEMEWAGLSSVRSFILKNLKPLTVFEATGSKTLQGLFQRVLDGEGVWANDVQGVHEKIKGIREKYGWQSWKMDERVAVETKSGTVRLSLSEMMSLYAYSFREQAISHLEGGGFVLDPSATAKGKYPLKVLEQKVNDARRYVMDMETMGALASQLTEEQKSYVKEMQAVLSEMGELGNEVSRKLYDMDLFNEKHYFPIKVRSDYLESQTGRTGDPNIKNRGAFKQTVPDADNPLVLEAFDKVFADHVNSMATYHAFVLPVEDLMRVINYNADTGMEIEVQKREFEKAPINKNILSLLQKIKQGVAKQSDRVYLDNLSEETTQKIKEITGIDVTGFKVGIESRMLEHILKDHGENGATDHSMSSDDTIAKLEYVLKNPDGITPAGRTQAYTYMKKGYNRTAPTVLYEKQIGEKSYYVVQAVPDANAKTLWIVTGYIGIPSNMKGTSQLIDARDANGHDPNATSEIGSASVPANSIPQNGAKVNPFDKNNAGQSYSTVKAAISGRYGEDVVKYIEQVVRDLNGGARRDATASILDSGITAFKRASTMASLSVLIQQPTSLIRAGAYIDYKYLMNTKGFIDLKDHKANWERLCKYAPVGVIKEMGGYDTGVGARTTEYLNAKEYKTLSERAGAFFKPEALGGDANYRAEIFGRGAAFADEMAWIQMFEACVSEQAEKLKKPRDAEEVLTAAGERFTEIVRRTQVYDSTLTRSELMRSKDTGMKMATAFGAEPTTIVSMVADAIIRGERGDVKFLRKSGGALAAAIIINAMAVSLVYAMRDDDEDKTYAEKYLSTLSAEIVEGFIPLSYLPFARDVMSLAQGYEVERSDMTLIGNLFDQVKLLTSSKRSVTDKVLGVTGAVSAFFGLPVTNMVRDAKGLINTFLGRVDTERTTGAGVSTALKEEFTTIFGLFDEQTTNAYQLYQAAITDDTAHYKRVAARYDSEKAVEQALRKALRENDPRIHEAAVARIEGEREVYESLIAQIEGEGHFDRDIIIRAINNQINYINDHAEDETVPKDEAAAAEAEEELHEALYSASDLNAALERGDTEDFIAMADILIYYKIDAGKTEAQAKASIKSSVTRYWKEKWIEAWKQNDTAEIKRIQSVLVSTGLYGDRNQVAELGQGWVKAYAAKTGLVSVSGSQTAGTGRIRLGN